VETMAPRANLVANVYDVNPEGEATMISRGAYLLRDLGRQRASFELYGQDWLVKKGHRLGVLISGSNAEWWLHLQTNTSVTVRSASIGLPFLAQRRQRVLDGESTLKLEDFLGTSFDVESSTIKANDRGFRLPPPLS
jgi:uncharacterized protein